MKITQFLKRYSLIDNKFIEDFYTFYDEADKHEAKPVLGIKRVGKRERYYDKLTCRWLS
jgi:hypothetical protein